MYGTWGCTELYIEDYNAQNVQDYIALYIQDSIALNVQDYTALYDRNTLHCIYKNALHWIDMQRIYSSLLYCNSLFFTIKINLSYLSITLLVYIITQSYKYNTLYDILHYNT